VAVHIGYPYDDCDKYSSWRDLQYDIHINSFTIGGIGIDAPLHGRQSKVPYARNCWLVQREINRAVSRIITVKLILKGISPIRKLVYAPLEDFVIHCC
jgi:hypothetical protein